jgi:uncharacterized membrane protein
VIVEFILRWFHVLFGIVWIGMLYYFNFVQTEYFKEAEAAAKADALKKLAPRALKWFRWGAMVTFLTGLGLLHFAKAMVNPVASSLIWMGALTGTLDVPQRVAGDLAEPEDRHRHQGWRCGGGSSQGGPRIAHEYAVLRPHAARHAGLQAPVHGRCLRHRPDRGLRAHRGCWKLNALFGRMGPMASVIGVVHLSIALAGVIWALLAFL